jgi:hypothetical protein
MSTTSIIILGLGRRRRVVRVVRRRRIIIRSVCRARFLDRVVRVLVPVLVLVLA